jgi:acetyl esterase/lipase
MTGLTYDEALAQEPELLEGRLSIRPDGTRHWPQLVYATPIGFRPLTLDLTVPPGDGPHPLVVYVHGGAWFIGSPSYDNRALRALDVTGRLTAAGIAVARIAYRLSGEAPWPAQLDDCHAALAWLRAKAPGLALDPARLAVMGESAGGHLAAMTGLTAAPGTVAAAVNWYGPTDLARFERDGTRRPMPDEVAHRPEHLLVGADAPDRAARLADASPLSHVHAAAPPFLHQHGDRDRLVSHAHAEALHAALIEAGVRSELEIVPGADHCFWGATGPAIMDRVLAFLRPTIGA